MKKIIISTYLLFITLICFSQDKVDPWFTGLSSKVNTQPVDFGIPTYFYDSQTNFLIQSYIGRSISKRFDFGILAEFSKNKYELISEPISVETVRRFGSRNVLGGDIRSLKIGWSKEFLLIGPFLRYNFLVDRKLDLDLSFSSGAQISFYEGIQYTIEQNEFEEEIVITSTFENRDTELYMRCNLGIGYKIGRRLQFRVVQDLIILDNYELGYLWDLKGTYFALEYRF